MEKSIKKHERKQITLADHFTTGRLLRFVLPSIVMMVFISIYGVVDGLFVSNVVGKTAFASINLIMPFLMVFGGIGFMIGTGGSAVVARTLGEGDRERANRIFSMLIYVTVVVGVIFSAIGIAFLEPIARLLGADDAMIPYCLSYGRWNLIALTAFMLQNVFQSFLVTAEKPKIGLAVTVAAGCTNMVLDYLFVAVFRWGVAGAAVATGLSQCVGGLIPLFWFLSKKNKSNLRFCRTKMEWTPMLRACGNGASEMLTSVSASITGILYNWQLMKYAGEDGVAAYGVIIYAAFVFIAIYMGYSSGCSPIMSYHYGAANHKEMKNVMSKSLKMLGGGAVVLTAAAYLLARPISRIFVGYDQNLFDMTVHGFMICAVPMLVMWFNIYASSFFTALNDGAVSAAISFMRSLVLPVICILALPYFFKLDGVWFALAASEFLSVIVSLFFMLKNRKKYQY